MPALPDIGSSLPEVLETDGSISVIPRDGDTPPSKRPPSDERTT